MGWEFLVYRGESQSGMIHADWDFSAVQRGLWK